MLLYLIFELTKDDSSNPKVYNSAKKALAVAFSGVIYKKIRKNQRQNTVMFCRLEQYEGLLLALNA
ncbi:hypothetical protein C9I43_17040 [Shewanella morhuae]|uniref:Transposase n=1 Tax=Shewanella morhuae TaxID=365591 RepID=A0ABX5HPH8_9GAMM|nr:hypothetical protein C9I43_17040 [Shewanella morhuae]